LGAATAQPNINEMIMLGCVPLQRHLLQRGKPPQRNDSPTYRKYFFLIDMFILTKLIKFTEAIAISCSNCSYP
jgi:hypothetical protein